MFVTFKAHRFVLLKKCYGSFVRFIAKHALQIPSHDCPFFRQRNKLLPKFYPATPSNRFRLRSVVSARYNGVGSVRLRLRRKPLDGILLS